MEKITHPVVVVFDVHILSMQDERAELFLDMISRIDTSSVRTLVLAGDVFDFCFGKSDFYREKFKEFGDALSSLSSKGVKVVFVHGNHEYAMDSIGWDGVEFLEGQNHIIELKGGQKVQVAHGDQIRPNRRYSFFRWIVRSWLFTFVASFIPGRIFDAIALKNSEISRAADKYRKLPHDRILHRAEQWLAAGEGDHGVFAHFHMPYYKETSNGKLISAGSWETPSVVVIDEEAIFARLQFKKVGEPFEQKDDIVFTG